MKHLLDAELVDLVDGRLPAARGAHVDRCDVCRSRAATLRATWMRAVDDAAPEPSPLFWDHFASRVSDAIGEEAPIAVDAPSWSRWLGHPVRAWTAAASVALLMLVAVAWRATLHAPAAPVVAAVSHATSVPAAGHAGDPVTKVATANDGPEDLETDGAWAVVRTAADGLAWDDAHAAGLSAHPGSAERIALELTAAERVELARLIHDELKHTGA